MGRRDSVPVEEALLATVGPSGRMISGSKSGYRKAHPQHLAVFNAGICLSPGRTVWHGDLDLTEDEPLLLDLARRTGAIVYVLYEHPSSQNQSPSIADAVYSVTPSGHTRFGYEYVERAVDGTVRRRKPPAPRRKRLVLTFGGPRLLRFWLWDTRRVAPQGGPLDSRFLYVGRTLRRHDRELPFLILALHRWRWKRRTILEWTWYPTPKRHAPHPLLHVRLVVSRGRIRPRVRVYAHPGFVHELVVGVEFGPKRESS